MTVTPEKQRPRVLVTGASGFIGSFVASYLQGNGYDVRAVSRAGNSSVLPVAESFSGPDFSKPFDAAPLVRGMDHVVHIAGLAHATQSIPEAAYTAINAEAAACLAVAAREQGVKRFIFMSSVRAQTGPSARGVVTEAHMPEPADAYGRSKLAGEAMVMEALSGSATRAIVLRPVLVYGPGVKGNMAVLMRAARSPWPLPVKGLGAKRSLLSRDNLASAVLHALASSAVASGPYLVADEEALTVADVVGALRQGLGRRPGTFRVPQTLIERTLRGLGREGDVDRLLGDLYVATGALRATGWQAAVPIREGLAAAIRGA